MCVFKKQGLEFQQVPAHTDKAVSSRNVLLDAKPVLPSQAESSCSMKRSYSAWGPGHSICCKARRTMQSQPPYLSRTKKEQGHENILRTWACFPDVFLQRSHELSFPCGLSQVSRWLDGQTGELVKGRKCGILLRRLQCLVQCPVPTPGLLYFVVSVGMLLDFSGCQFPHL